MMKTIEPIKRSGGENYMDKWAQSVTDDIWEEADQYNDIINYLQDQGGNLKSNISPDSIMFSVNSLGYKEFTPLTKENLGKIFGPDMGVQVKGSSNLKKGYKSKEAIKEEIRKQKKRIMHSYGITPATLEQWKKANPEKAKSLKLQRGGTIHIPAVQKKEKGGILKFQKGKSLEFQGNAYDPLERSKKETIIGPDRDWEMYSTTSL